MPYAKAGIIAQLKIEARGAPGERRACFGEAPLSARGRFVAKATSLRTEGDRYDGPARIPCEMKQLSERGTEPISVTYGVMASDEIETP
jgi:hypothetical protein